jgi:hypothetical protein
MCKKAILTLAVLALASVTVFAVNKDGVDGVVLSKDGRRAIVTKGAQSVTRMTPSNDTTLVKIAGNLATAYPKGSYWCCSGFTLTGPTALSGFPEFWEAVPFTPSANHTITKVKVAVSLIQGTNGLVLSLYNDASGLPGTAIKTWQLKNVPNIATCCTVETKGTIGIPVTAGTQYWVVVKTDANDPDTFAVWNDNDTNQVDASPVAFYCSQDVSGSCNNNDAWTTFQAVQGPAFAVLGSN